MNTHRDRDHYDRFRDELAEGLDLTSAVDAGRDVGVNPGKQADETTEPPSSDVVPAAVPTSRRAPTHNPEKEQ
jgi:hypothetical protein